VHFNSPPEATKAAAHNFGARTGMPKREFLDIRAQSELEVMAEAIRDEIVAQLTGK
jgi:phage gpG-like protein